LKHTEKTIKARNIFTGRILKLDIHDVMLENNKVAEREVISHPGGVAVIPVTYNKEIYLVNQFRKPYESEVLEIPAGKLDPGEDPLVCAKRELREETGMSAKELTYIGSFATTPAFTNEIIYLYLATGLMSGQDSTDPDEFIEVEKRPLTDLLNGIEQGEIQDAKTIIALLMAARKGLFK
jgi:ADP-ribose pyrophosphatase